jgi:predicted nicotinamide N-methyase
MVRLVTYQVPTTRELEDREIKQTGVFTLAIPR